jgi:hypothetical protein
MQALVLVPLVLFIVLQVALLLVIQSRDEAWQARQVAAVPR